MRVKNAHRFKKYENLNIINLRRNILLYMENDINNRKKIKDNVLAAIWITLLTAAALVFGILFIADANIAFIAEYRKIFLISYIVVVSAASVLSVVFYLVKREIFYKLLLIFLGLAAGFLAFFYLTSVTGLWDKVDSVEDLREFVSSYGRFTIPAFILLQFLQVVLLPIPGMITTGAGVALFGPFFGALYSFIGITAASFVAFFIGRRLGYKVAGWLVGQETLDKWLEVVKNKDKVVLTFMFIFPFFPDDILCFVAGLSSMSAGYYSVMIIITRLLSVYVTSYSFSGRIIPYNTWWGIIIWAILFAFTLAICYYIYKKGDAVEKFFKDKFGGRKNGKSDDSSR